jgi:hypothetical protein
MGVAGSVGPAGPSPTPGPLGPRTDNGNTGTFVGIGAGNPASTQDTAIGVNALALDTGAGKNVAVGNHACAAVTTGDENVAIGANASAADTTGRANVAIGFNALAANNGTGNVAVGNRAAAGMTGNNKTSLGEYAFQQTSTGDFNIGIGDVAGYNASPASNNNIYLGSPGPSPAASESNTIRIGYFPTDVGLGFTAHTAAYLAGVSGETSATGVNVLIGTDGKLGTTTSSRAFKRDIRDMGEDSDRLMSLRPVTFKYKPEYDRSQLRQYGLVAEEVAQVDKDLVTFKPTGEPEAVRYHFVNAMLLNEVQKQHKHIEAQEARIKALNARLESLEKALAAQPRKNY